MPIRLAAGQTDAASSAAPQIASRDSPLGPKPGGRITRTVRLALSPAACVTTPVIAAAVFGVAGSTFSENCGSYAASAGAGRRGETECREDGDAETSVHARHRHYARAVAGRKRASAEAARMSGRSTST